MNAFGYERLVAAQCDDQLQEIGGGFETALGPAFASDNLHRQLIARIHGSIIGKNGENSSFIWRGWVRPGSPRSTRPERDCASEASRSNVGTLRGART